MRHDLIIFIKNPVLGTAKTRLAASIGDEAALGAYRQLLAYTKNVVSALKVRKSVWYSSYIEDVDIWDEKTFNKELQFGKDLGDKMKNAFKKTFEIADAVVIIGSDCAELKARHIEEAFEKLKSTEVVIGPAKDGGYYLLGTRKFLPELFEEITWSTSSVTEQTIERIKELGLSYELLEKLNDVDTIEDWLQIKDRLPAL